MWAAKELDEGKSEMLDLTQRILVTVASIINTRNKRRKKKIDQVWKTTSSSELVSECL